MLPQALVCLLAAWLAIAQSPLPLNSVTAFNSSNLPNPPVFSLPQSKALTISVGVCSDPTSSDIPGFSIVNDTNGGQGSKIPLVNGVGNWKGTVMQGGVLKAENVGGLSFEIGVSDSGPFHETILSSPLVGDTTSNQVLIFSPIFLSVPPSQPSYPNYTLPPANLSFPTLPPNAPNLTLIVDVSSNTNLTTIPQSGCRLKAAKSAGTILDQKLWLRDGAKEGWRMQWLMEGLTPSTNYTAYVVQSDTKVGGPIFFTTKSATFSCPLVHSLPFCPSTSYSVPLPAPPSSLAAYDSTNLPTTITSPILTYLTNFTTSLSTFACGRDIYSPLQTCADCQRAYRKWLCSVSFTRCGERSTPSASPSPNDNAQSPLPALSQVNPSSKQRNPNLPAFPSEYTELLPCHETCTAVDRACPSFIGFRCPVVRFNAAKSYGVGYIDSGQEGDMGNGMTGAWSDKWGRVWCNGS